MANIEGSDKARTDTPGTPESVGSFFGQRASPWIRAYSGAPERWPEYNNFVRRERYALSLISEERRGTVIDLGCGAGHALVQMKGMGFDRMIGIDISHNMLETAQK